MNCRILLLVFVTASISSCDQDHSPAIAVNGDYYPATNSTQGKYLRESFNPATKEVFKSDTIQIVYDNDVTYKDRVYKKLDFYSKWQAADNTTIINHDVYRLLRKDGRQYFTPYSSDSSEYVFLDTEKGAGSSWIYYQGFEDEYKSVYTIKGVNQTKIVNSTAYKNVVEVLQEGYFMSDKKQYELTSSVTAYYVKDVGQIYYSSEFYSYPSGLRITLIN
jgi:hypothetical protein